jgi:peptide chain release factor 2/peptide chain release factor
MTRHVVQVSAGHGPVEVRRFVARLAARLEALCEACGLVVEEAAFRGEEQAPWSVDLTVRGDAPALLAGELGTHALVARSPDRGRASRKRWYAGVSVHPFAEAAAEARIRVDPADLEISATTAPGPGGQHVNNTATSVRVRHLPSGVTVRVSDERSQRANLERAIQRICHRLACLEAARRAEGEAARRLSHHRVERGAPVRTYRLGTSGELSAR